MIRKIFFTSLLAFGFLLAFTISSQAGDCGTAGVYEGTCKDVNDCSDYYTNPDVGCNFTGEVCCKGSTTTSSSSSCQNGTGSCTPSQSSSCSGTKVDDSSCLPGFCCVTSSGSSCQNGTGSCTPSQSSSCSGTKVDDSSCLPGFCCVTGSSTSEYCEDHSSEGYFVTSRSKNCSDTEGATDATEYTTQSSDYKCCKKSSSSGSGSTGIDGIDLPSSSETGLTDRSILEIVSTVLGWLLKIFLLLATIAFIITGLQFLFALGSSYSDAATNAKKNFAYSIIALVVVGAGYIIILTIDLLLKG